MYENVDMQLTSLEHNKILQNEQCFQIKLFWDLSQYSL